MVKIAKKFFDLLFVIVIILLAIYVILRVDNRIMIYNVKTGSMEDKIHVDDYILILKKDDYKVGDVVTFQREDYFITHRIIRKNGNVITTKGDANNTEDENIEKSKIVGKVIIIGGVLNYIIRYKYTLVGLLLTLYLVTCYFESNSENKNKKDKEQNGDSKEENIEEVSIQENAEEIDSIHSGKTIDDLVLEDEELSEELQEIKENNDKKSDNIDLKEKKVRKSKKQTASSSKKEKAKNSGKKISE